MSIVLYDFTYATISVPVQAKPYLDKVWKPIDMGLFTDTQYEDVGRSNHLFMNAMYLNDDTKCFDIVSTEAIRWIDKLRTDGIPINAYGYMVEENLLFDDSYTNSRSLSTLTYRDGITKFFYTMEYCCIDNSAFLHLSAKEILELAHTQKIKYLKYLDLIAFTETDIKNLYASMALHIIES